MVLQVMSGWCERRKEDWFCTHIGWRPLRTASVLASLLHFLVSTCLPTPPTHPHVFMDAQRALPLFAALFCTGPRCQPPAAAVAPCSLHCAAVAPQRLAQSGEPGAASGSCTQESLDKQISLQAECSSPAASCQIYGDTSHCSPSSCILLWRCPAVQYRKHQVPT